MKPTLEERMSACGYQNKKLGRAKFTVDISYSHVRSLINLVGQILYQLQFKIFSFKLAEQFEII